MKKILNCIAVLLLTTSIFTCMSCSQDVTMPEDKTAPAEVTNFSVTLENTTASLSWTNPSDDDFAGVQISMTPAEGFLSTPISIGKSSTSFIVTGLKTESTYLFTLKTFDNKLNYSIGVSIQKTVKKDNSSGSSEDKEPEQPKDPIIPDDPENPKEDEPIEPNIDTIPPAQVSDFIAEYSPIETSIRLSWTNPQDKDFAGTEILWGNYNSAEYFTLSFDKSYSSTIISGIAADDSEYFFRICTKDESGNIGESVQTNVVAINDEIPFCDVRTGDYILKNKTYVRKEYYSELTQDERNSIIGIALVPDSGVPVILGLKFPDTSLMWAVAGTTGGNSYFTDLATNVNKSYINDQDYEYTITGDLDGSDNWDYICSIDSVGTQNSATSYPAFYFANMYAAVAGLMGSEFADSWYVPSINELYEVSKQFDALNESLKTLGITLPIISELKIGNTKEEDYIRFWSSSQSYSLDYSAYVLEGIAEENYGMYAGYYYSYGNFSLENINRGSNAYVWAFHNFDVREIKPYDNYGTPEILDVIIKTVGENYTGKIPVTIYGNDLLSGTITSDNTTFTDVKYLNNTIATATISNPGYVGEHSITVSCGDSTYNGTYNVALYDDYFKIVNIGGEDSGYTIAYPDNSDYQYSFYDTTTSGNYNNYSGNYKSYIESLTFSEAFREKYASVFNGDKVNIEWREFAESSYGESYATEYDFLYLINQLTTLCTPAFEDMIETFLTNYEWTLTGYNDYDCLKEYEFYIYYVTMILSSYNYGYSGATYNGSKWSDYESSIEDDVIDLWNRLFSEEIFNTTPPIADIASDINNGCPLIVEQMNIHLAYAAEKMQVELTDLQNLLNLSFIIETLEPIGDTSENRDPYYDNPMIKKDEGIYSKFFDEYNQ